MDYPQTALVNTMASCYCSVVCFLQGNIKQKLQSPREVDKSEPSLAGEATYRHAGALLPPGGASRLLTPPLYPACAV